jgi:hypothetical protein
MAFCTTTTPKRRHGRIDSFAFHLAHKALPDLDPSIRMGVFCVRAEYDSKAPH